MIDVREKGGSTHHGPYMSEESRVADRVEEQPEDRPRHERELRAAWDAALLKDHLSGGAREFTGSKQAHLRLAALLPTWRYSLPSGGSVGAQLNTSSSKRVM
jgi:hypothetical protein